jgi:hypothetical protein
MIRIARRFYRRQAHEYIFKQYSELQLGDIICCMSSGGYFRIFKKVETSLLARTKVPDAPGEFEIPRNYIVGARVTGVPMLTRPVAHSVLVERINTKRFYEDDGAPSGPALHLCKSPYLYRRYYYWSRRPLEIGDVITDSQEDLIVHDRVKEMVWVTDCGMAARQEPNEYYVLKSAFGGSTVKHTDGRSLIGDKYPVVITASFLLRIVAILN